MGYLECECSTNLVVEGETYPVFSQDRGFAVSLQRISIIESHIAFGDETDDNQVSKAAAVHVTRQLAYDLSHKNISVRVNGIAPGTYSRSH